MTNERTVCDAWLAKAGLPYDVLIPLLHQRKGSVNVFRAFMARESGIRDSIPSAQRKILAENASSERMEAMRECMEQHQIRSVTILDSTFPLSLRNISDPPGILFFQGNPACLQRKRIISMVGSRSASYDGLKASRRIAMELSRNGVAVVSGLAYGIDAACHEGCIEGGSPTIAILGCGPDLTYPAENEPLKKSILEHGGLIMSEYAPGTKPLPFHFPYRNRLISGIADAVVLMEAKIRSGSMTTVSHALNQGKDVFAYPGDPASPKSEGNRTLLREGARFFTKASDLLEDMQWLDNLPHVGQNSEGSSGCSPGNAAEEAVYRALVKGVLGFDELIQLTGLSPSSLMSTITVLQMKKMIEVLPGKRYQIRQE